MSYFILILSLIIQTCFLNARNSVQDTPYVTCNIHGQLGNQLHQVATTLAYAWDNNFQPIFPELNKTESNACKNRDTIFRKLKTIELPRPPQYVFKNFVNFLKKTIPYKEDIRLEGYFQTYEYYDHHRARLIKTFEPEPSRLAKIVEKHKKLLDHPKTVAIHVRTFNKYWSSIIPFCGVDYYERAINLFPEEMLFVVFSDRINWCKHHFQKFNRNIIYVESQDYLDDFYLMSMMKHNIIGNSSFSFWSAYINVNPNKIVIAPSHFIQPQRYHKHAAIPPKWIVLDLDLKAPYPADITHYDNVSQSLDTQ